MAIITFQLVSVQFLSIDMDSWITLLLTYAYKFKEQKLKHKILIHSDGKNIVF